MTAIKNLGHLFDNVHINGKKDIIRSTLKENGVFSEGKVRTEKLNNLILLTTHVDGQCGENKKAEREQKLLPFRLSTGEGTRTPTPFGTRS